MQSPGCACVEKDVLEETQPLDWGESMGVALIWLFLCDGKMWDFLPHLECRPGVGDQIGVSPIPPRLVVLLHLCNNSV